MAMKHELNFWVVGGDMRQCKLAQLLAEDGHRVHTYGMEEGVTPVSGLTMEKSLEGITLADCVVLPLPISDGDGELNAPLTQQKLMIADVLGVLAPKQVVCGGRVDAETAALAAERGLTILDYYAREELIVANAVPRYRWLPAAMTRWPGPKPWAMGRRKLENWWDGCAGMTWL